MGLGSPMLRIVTAPFWKDSDIFVDFNYGLMKVKKTPENDDISVVIEIRDIQNNIRLEKILSLKNNLTYNEDELKYGLMCISTHKSHNNLL